MPALRAFALLLATLPVAPALHAQASAAALTPEEQAVLAPIKALFEGMTARDPAAIQKPLLPGGSLILMQDGNPRQITFQDFATRVGQPSPRHIEERIHSPLIRIDHDLAVVWAPFNLLVDGKVDHCGTDLFQLIRKDGRWIIAAIADTETRTCQPV